MTSDLSQFNSINRSIHILRDKVEFFHRLYKDVTDITSMKDLESVPFCEKKDLLKISPDELLGIAGEKNVRIHSSSGTLGHPVAVPYTSKDLEVWKDMFSRSFKLAGIKKDDVVQIMTGYGLWTAGIGFETAAEAAGALTIPIGPGNTRKQVSFMEDYKTSVLCATSSYAFYLSEKLKDHPNISLKKVILGSERTNQYMLHNIKRNLNVKVYDTYGLTEIYGPGIAMSCNEENGMHYYNDYLLFEIIDSHTLKRVKDGQYGELVITTLCKEGLPLVRFRTHDITRIIPGPCSCGCQYPRIASIKSRTDDMIKMKGCIFFPYQIEEIISHYPQLYCEYEITLKYIDSKECAILKIESHEKNNDLIRSIVRALKDLIGFQFCVELVDIGSLPRFEKKAMRIKDLRYQAI